MLRHFISSLRSSTAEHSPDKRETVERHHAEGPNAGWLRQMSGGLKIRTGGRATHSSGQFRGIDVTETCESSKLDTSGQHRHAAPFSSECGRLSSLPGSPHFPVSVADIERRLSCKQVHVGANPTGGSISNTLHVVTVSIPRCERGGAGANPAVGTIDTSRHHKL